MLNPDVSRVSNTGSAHAAVSKLGVTGEAYLVAGVNDQRRTVRFSNEGATTIWFGASNNMTPGASALNFAGLVAGSNTEVKDYSGDVYAWAGGGASLAPNWLGVVDIG